MILGSFSQAYANRSKALFEKANKKYNSKEYAIAASLYTKLIKDPNLSKQDKLTAYINGAACYYYNHDYKNALKWYALAIQHGAKEPIYYYKLAECLKMNGRYIEAIAKFEEYQKMVPDDPNTAVMIEGCKLAIE